MTVQMYRYLPALESVDETLDWCDRNNVSGARMERGPDGRVRGLARVGDVNDSVEDEK